MGERRWSKPVPRCLRTTEPLRGLKIVTSPSGAASLAGLRLRRRGYLFLCVFLEIILEASPLWV